MIWRPYFLRGISAGVDSARLRGYLITILWQVIFASVVLAFWRGQARSDHGLGLLAPGGGGFIVGAAFVGIVAIGLFSYARQVGSRIAAGHDAGLNVSLENPLLPKTSGGLFLFGILAVAAAVSEEIFYRGYLMWFAERWLSPWTSVLATALVFAMAHSFQGPRNAVRLFFFGLVLSVLYLVSGSLWLSMALHAIINANSGLLSYMRAVAEE
ncbi:MAG: CPBP family intramembrane metalloprotease [Gemmatimonadetes bacterium]|nr:CPBP family intramembrane metalloprotease [Gemmatimonadota bacterium]